jgi:hypothetical protein
MTYSEHLSRCEQSTADLTRPYASEQAIVGFVDRHDARASEACRE